MGDPAKTRELALKAKTYKIFAKIFAVVGLILMAFLFYLQSGGNIMLALKNPSFAALMILPFIPSIIFIMISAKAEKQLKKALGENAQQGSAKDAPLAQIDKKTTGAGK